MRGPRLETIMLNGSPYECFTSEKYYWFRERYESDLREQLESVLTPDSVLYDVGANAGFWPVMLHARCKHIYAFEPSPVNFARLRKNTSHLPNVTAINAACSDSEGALYFSERGSMSCVSESGIEVPALRLDDFSRSHLAPTVVKIDVEGFGAKVLSGLGELHPAVLMEVHNQEEAEALNRIPRRLIVSPPC